MSCCVSTRRLRTIVMAAAAIIICPIALAQTPARRTVLAVYWSPEDFPTNPIASRAIREELARSSAPIDYYAEYLESDRLPGVVAVESLREYIRLKYRDRPIDVVIANSSVALDFVVRYRQELFPDAPIIYNGIDTDDLKLREAGAGMTGVLNSSSFGATLDLALTLHPDTERVFVVANSPSATLPLVLQKELQPFASRVDITYITNNSRSAMLAAVKAVPVRSSLVLFIRHAQEPERSMEMEETARLVSGASPVPVYGVTETFIGLGLVGGRVYGIADQAARAGRMAVRVLDGARAQDIPMERATLVPIFDWRQLQRWRIDPSRLPAGSDIRFRMPTPWQQYRWYILGALTLVILQSMMIASLVIQRARRRETEARYALATQAGGVGVWDWNLETNAMYIDPMLKSILGYAGAEIPNRVDDWARHVHPDDKSLVMDRVQQHLDGKTVIYEAEHRMVHRNGSARWFLARGSAVRRNGRPVRIIGTHTDITERKASEHALHDAQAEVARLSRLTALGEFAASIAHEIRQPISAILMNALTCLRWLDSGKPDLGEVGAALSDVVEAGRRADAVIERNRELFRHQKIEKASLDINSVINGVTLLLKTRLVSSHVTLVTSLAPDLPTVIGDPVELQQVLLNLVANAIDAMDNVPFASRRLEISSHLRSDSSVQVSVRDTGVGLADVDVSKMFALSYTTKPAGSGVGLAISRSIIDAHGGELWAEPNAETGAAFSFTVPCEPAAASRPS
jgi:PAS domain S-box-containing protein